MPLKRDEKKWGHRRIAIEGEVTEFLTQALSGMSYM